jgi:hypothetical protein
VRDLYRRWFPLVEGARATSLLNPGDGWVSPLTLPPVVAESVLEAMLIPHVLSGRLRIVRNARLIGAEHGGDRVTTATFEIHGEEVAVSARFFLDATETGDFIAAAGVEHVIGSESRDQTGEPHAPVEANPSNTQAFTIAMAVEHHPGENHAGSPPPEYDYWRRATLPGWPGNLLSWTGCDPRTLQPRRYTIDFEHRGATAGAPDRDVVDLWSYRRVVSAAHHPADLHLRDVTILNWPMNDYAEGSIVEDADAPLHLDRARHLTASLLHWLQTEAPRPDGGSGYPGLCPHPASMGTADGYAEDPYVREGRRILAEYTVTEGDVAADCRSDGRAATYPDSVGTGAYRIDLHPTTGGDPYLDISTYPYEIPARAMIPIRVENVLAAAKNIGTTHITNGCYRVHPTEWTIGEAAGMLAAFCVERATIPKAVAHRPPALAEFQTRLTDAGFALSWPTGIGAL